MTNEQFGRLFSNSNGEEKLMSPHILHGMAMVCLIVGDWDEYTILDDYYDILVAEYETPCPCLVDKWCEPDDMRDAA